MTYYLVKQSVDELQLHDEGGTVIDDYSERPTISEMAASLSDGYSLISDGYIFRDLTIDDESVPWDSE